MTSWLFLGMCGLAVIAFAIYMALGRLGGIEANPQWRPGSLTTPPGPPPGRDRVVWESVSMRYASHRAQCVHDDSCPECRSLGRVLTDLLTRPTRRNPSVRESLDRDVARVLDGHVPDEAGLCRACVGGHARQHSCR